MRRTGTLEDAVIAADMGAAAGLVSLEGMRTFTATRAGSRGLWLVQRALGLAVEESWSPMETRLRLIWERDAGWPRPLCNRPVYGPDGRFVGRPDLIDPVAGVIGEFDGADHRDRARHRRDVKREDGFRRVGLEMFTVVGGDLHDVPLVVERMAAAKARAGTQPRLWVIGPA